VDTVAVVDDTVEMGAVDTVAVVNNGVEAVEADVVVVFLLQGHGIGNCTRISYMMYQLDNNNSRYLIHPTRRCKTIHRTSLGYS